MEITIYGVLLHVLLDNVDAVMDAEPDNETPDSLLGLLSIRNQPFMIHAVIDNYILEKLGKHTADNINEAEIYSIIEEDDPYFGTLLAVAAGSDVIFHPNPSETPYANAKLSLVRYDRIPK
ncbi:hypothetical protein GOB85_14925 [Acetobacter sp. LMG 1636]|uniref:Uncharacterized protein n=1 Tax=Acetobacter fallax TaxID=1737473 RepID=A0ABX0KFC0_9PROT|nr:hypothetical protein [Acetobacter fallax]NHO37377.1 hypothetical protein [Acetobacter fallax]